jgi:hypothetical protein
VRSTRVSGFNSQCRGPLLFMDKQKNQDVTFRSGASYVPGVNRLSISSDTSAQIALNIPTLVKFKVPRPSGQTALRMTLLLPATAGLGRSGARQSSWSPSPA